MPSTVRVKELFCSTRQLMVGVCKSRKRGKYKRLAKQLCWLFVFLVTFFRVGEPQLQHEATSKKGKISG
jgi:hypothetical protein